MRGETTRGRQQGGRQRGADNEGGDNEEGWGGWRLKREQVGRRHASPNDAWGGKALSVQT